MVGRDHWLTIAAAADPDELREHILTGYKAGKPFTPYVPTIPLPRPVDRVLDLGCGLGRSFPYLKQIAQHVTGFDLPPMVARCRVLAPTPADRLVDCWEDVRDARFDLIVAVLVLQHLDPAVCRGYLEDCARMTPALYVLTRARSDFGPNVLAIAAETGCFDADVPVEVEHDSSTHQLRVVGRRSIADASEAHAGHFEVLLRSHVACRPI